MASKRKRAQPSVDTEELFQRARATLERDGVIRLASVGPSAVRTDLVARLCRAGFEQTKTALRRPVQLQLRAALEHGAALPLVSVKEHLAGVSKVEAELAVAALLSEGVAQRVLRGGKPWLFAGSTPGLSRAALQRLQRELEGVTKLAAMALKTEHTTLLVSDVQEALLRALPEVAREPGAPVAGRSAPRSKAETVEPVLRAVDAVRDERMGLSFVPRVVDFLRRELGLSVDAAKSALLEAAAAGLLELRPEGGMNRLDSSERELCPPGPEGTQLSWARLRRG